MSELLRETTASWWALFAPLVLQGTLILLLDAALDGLLLRRAWPELRAALWSVALLRLVLPLEGLDAQGSLQSASWGVPLPFSLDALASGEASGVVSGAQVAFVAWALGALVTLVALASAYARALRRAEAASTRAWPAWVQTLLEECAAACGLRRVPALVGSPLVGSPFVAGFRRPRVYVPLEILDTLSAEELRHVLLHELIHVKRRDAWRALAVGLVTALHWYHPIGWLAARRLEALREQCCDRDVARTLGPEAGRYRQTLLALSARALGLSVRPPAGSPGFLGRHAGLVTRLRVLEHEPSRRARLRQTLTAVSCALLLVLLVPVAPASSEALHRIGDALERPPGCLLLRMEVLRRVAEEDATRGRK